MIGTIMAIVIYWRLAFGFTDVVTTHMAAAIFLEISIEIFIGFAIGFARMAHNDAKRLKGI